MARDFVLPPWTHSLSNSPYHAWKCLFVFLGRCLMNTQ